jgi:hypothetical protein
MVLRQEVYPPMTTKNAELTFTEWDDRVIDIYRVIQDVVNGDNVDAYNPAKTYDGTSSDVYSKFAGYNSRIWQAVYAGTFTGETPEEGIYWTQVTLAQMLPNVLKLAEIGSGASNAIQQGGVLLPSAEILTLGATPVAFGLTVPVDSFPDILTAKCFRPDVDTAYATNTVVAIRCVGADDPLFTLDFLGKTATGSGGFYMERYVSTNVNNKQIIHSVDLEVYVIGGDPTAGTFDSGVTITFAYTPA